MMTGSGGRLALRERTAGDLAWLECGDGDWRVAFSTRRGGCSPPPWDSLNLGGSVGDEPDRVHGNRARLLAAVGLAGERVVIPRQVHGTRVLEVDDHDVVPAATLFHDPHGPLASLEADGLLTRHAGIGLWVSFADCVPVFLAGTADGGGTAIALVHAGWRGMADGIVDVAARGLAATGPLRAAVIGPSIGPCHFDVSPAVAGTFEQRWPGVVRDRRVDLWEVAVRQLESHGLRRSDILVTRLCTVCDGRFFSHRRDRGLTGRQAAVAWVGSANETKRGGGP